MRLKMSGRLLQTVFYLAVVIGMGVGAWLSRDRWLPRLKNSPGLPQAGQEFSLPVDEPKVLKLSPQARANLGLSSKPVKIQSYWRRVQIPGVIVDRPGMTDRGITSPIAGVIIQVHAFEGDVIRPGEKLFSLRIVSEYLQKLQSDLFKAIRETEILMVEMDRLHELATSGVIPRKRILELEQQVSRQAVLIDAYRQNLISRGLLPEQVEQIEDGTFLTTIDIHAPENAEPGNETAGIETAGNGLTKTASSGESDFFEIQELMVDLGQQVDVGQALAVLANHSSLYIKGHAFKKEASKLARAAENKWPVSVDFTEDIASDWVDLPAEFHIRHLSNTTDPNSRTFDFFIPLTNQSRIYQNDDRTFITWRFRSGQRVRIAVPVEELHNVIVLPAAAVIFEGPEAFVFQQNGDLCNRIPVKVLHQDSADVVIADDGSILPGFYICQCSAASLNRIMKSQAASGMRADVHVHADGTTHEAH